MQRDGTHCAASYCHVASPWGSLCDTRRARTALQPQVMHHSCNPGDSVFSTHLSHVGPNAPTWHTLYKHILQALVIKHTQDLRKLPLTPRISTCSRLFVYTRMVSLTALPRVHSSWVVPRVCSSLTVRFHLLSSGLWSLYLARTI